MAYEKEPLTDAQRAALKPAFEKVEKAYDEFEKAMMAAGVRRDNDDIELGVCFRCSRETGLCSSFLGNGRLCARPFCRHPRLAHA
jgi:hypothetical protein